MIRRLLATVMLAPPMAAAYMSTGAMRPQLSSQLSLSKVAMGGKGFGGGEATRDPAPTSIDPSDPKGKQQAIFKAESFAEYLARRQAGGGDAAATAPSPVTLPAWLSEAQKAELKATADAMSAPNKGFLASDESAGPWLRAGHVDAAKVPDTAENRAAYRSMLYQAPGLSDHISGVILHWETLFQTDAAGHQMVDLITRNGMIPGIKLDKGCEPLHRPIHKPPSPPHMQNSRVSLALNDRRRVTRVWAMWRRRHGWHPGHAGRPPGAPRDVGQGHR